jgi:hypothetical protein
MKKQVGKNERFSMRFDGATKFALDLLAEQERKKKVTVIEDAIIALANKLCEKQLGQHLSAIYDPHDGVRTLNLLALPGYKKSPHEDLLRAFVVAHKEFFYADEKATIPNVGLVVTLWDKVEHYLELWQQKRHENYWVAAEEMEERLKKAKIKPPKYGQGK